MKQLIQSFVSHRDLYALSITAGSVFSVFYNLCVTISEQEIFGLSISVWLIAFVINVIDIITGMKADTVRKKKEGEKFVFVSRKGWRAFEKIIVFTLIIWFVNSMEIEVVRLELWSRLSGILLFIKIIMLFYVILIETQSIGENEEVRFGKKSRMFVLLDDVIEIISEGLLTKLKGLFK